ncbi:MAG: DUF4173 domain-containing protein [Hyphomicrobiales bacterium]|nr:DUF4173 domain-containing protein [Hyphomicrobiales bacterium]
MTIQTESASGITESAAAIDDRSVTRWYLLGISLALGLAADQVLLGHKPGISLTAFLAAIGLCAFIACRRSDLADLRNLIFACIAFVAALIPLVENFSPLSFAIGLCGLCAFTLIITGSLTGSAVEIARKAATLITSGPFTFPPALINAGLSVATNRRHGGFHWVGWVLPLGFGSLFLYLFQSANPIIEQWLERFDLFAWIAEINFRRVLFCLAMMALSWPFLQGRLPERRFRWFRKSGMAGEKTDTVKTRSTAFSGLFGHTAIVRSLVLFNALFAVQIALDVVYLWGGRELPEGMSFATYAHRGAYPLVATALIAAVFTLVAMRHGSETENSAPVRNLVLPWTGQNVLLVVSSIFRLDLYVNIYALTLLRIEAFVWMALVAVGLVLIMVRVVFNYSNLWLVRWNLISLALTLYACSLVNIPAVIARYNVDHSVELSGRGVPLDVRYLVSLGPQVIPALDRYVRLRSERREFSGAYLHSSLYEFNVAYVKRQAYLLKRRLDENTSNWRSWTLRDARLKKCLRNKQHLQP